MSDSLVRVTTTDRVARVEMRGGPNNLLSTTLLTQLADSCEALAQEPDCRVIMLLSAGRHFCAGMDLAREAGGSRLHVDREGTSRENPLYTQALRLFRCPLPIVAAVRGAAIGGGLGLALVADFRVVTEQAKLAANFSRLGLHHGFGLSATLPRLIGPQRTAELLYTGQMISGARAVELGLCDEVAPDDELEAAARRRATAIAGSAPLAVRAIRTTLRADLIASVGSALDAEHTEQLRLAGTEDSREGFRAVRDRREPRFVGR